MSRRLKLALASAVLTIIGGVACARLLLAHDLALPTLGTLPAFSLVDEHGGSVTRDSLLGHVTIVDFVFTSCSTACPMLSAEMARLQHAGLGDDVRLLSISVDPERDTPERLREFASRYGADPAIWRFARGDDEAVRKVVVDGMKQLVERQMDRGEVDGFTILHGTKFVVIDDHARIRSFHDAHDAASMARLRTEVAALSRGRVVESAEVVPTIDPWAKKP